MDRLPHAIELVTRDCTGAALAEILQVSRRSADRRLYAVRQLGHCDGWSAADLAHLALWEHRHLGSAHLREAMDPAAPAPQAPANSLSAASAVEALATHQSHNLMLLARLAQDCSDGILDEHEARRLLPLAEEALGSGAKAMQALRDLKAQLRAKLGG